MKMTRYEFLQAVAQELLTYKTESVVSPPPSGRRNNCVPQELFRDVEEGTNESPHVAVECMRSKPRCVVCLLELSQYLNVNRKINKLRDTSNDNDVEDKARRARIVQQGYEGVKRKVAMCRECGVHVHSACLAENNKFLHNIFPGKSCMEILHSRTGKEIWNVPVHGSKKVSVNYKHTVVQEIRRCVEDTLLGEIRR